MSCRDIIWAIDLGRTRKLTTAERMVLITLCDRANGSRICWPSMRTISIDTGLSERQVRYIVHRLASKDYKLIELELRGRAMQYRILRPKDDETTETNGGEHRQPVPLSDDEDDEIAATSAAIDTGNDAEYRQPVPVNTGKTEPSIPAPGATKPTKIEPTKKPRAREREAKAFSNSRLEGKQASKPADRGGGSRPAASLDALELSAEERANVTVWMRHEASGDLSAPELTKRLSFIRMRYRDTGYRWLSDHVPTAAAIAATQGWHDARVGASP